jgi:hypothetical protein
LGRHALARVARRGRIRRPQQHHHKARGIVRPTPGVLPSWAPLPALLHRSGCRATTSRSSHLGCPPSVPAKASAQGTPGALRLHRSAGSSTARAAVRAGGGAAANAGANQRGRKPTRAQTRSLSTQAFSTTAMANSFFRSSTASTRRFRGVRFPPRRLPALRTSSPLGRAPFRRNAVSRSSSPSNGPNSRPCVSTTLARVLSSSASSTCLRSTRPLSRNPLFALRSTDWRSKPTTPRPATSFGSPFHGSGPSGPRPPTMPWTQRSGRRLSPRREVWRFPCSPPPPRLNSSTLAKCGCKKHCMDFDGDHRATCTALSGATKAHDWMVSVIGPLFRTAGHTVRAHNMGSWQAQANSAATWRSATTYETKRAAGAWSSTSASPITANLWE